MVDNSVTLFCSQIELLYPQPGWVEMDENVLWQQVQEVVKEGIQGTGCSRYCPNLSYGTAFMEPAIWNEIC